MRSTKIVTLGLITVLMAAVSCSDGPRRNPGKIYMPDMAYSRAVETYTDHSNLKTAGINYDATPVAGTVKRGDVAYFPLAKDSAGSTKNYDASVSVPNPLAALSEKEMQEAGRLYQVNCGICHGSKLDGNGPLYNGGNGPFPIAPRNLLTDPVLSMPAGQMMYSLTYGKNMMGSYAAQLSTKQRWMIIHFIQNAQGKNKPTAAAATDTTKTTK
ncbi:MAG: cytochrome c [Lacibacter sp.]